MGIILDSAIIQTSPTELTISSGEITVTQGFHTVDTESDAATDDLDTINGLEVGQEGWLKAENTARTVVFKHGTGNIYTNTEADISLTTDKMNIRYICDEDGDVLVNF